MRVKGYRLVGGPSLPVLAVDRFSIADQTEWPFLAKLTGESGRGPFSRYSTSSYYDTDSAIGSKWTIHGNSHGHSVLQLAIAGASVYFGVASTMYSTLSMDICRGLFLGGGAGIDSVSRFQVSYVGQIW